MANHLDFNPAAPTRARPHGAAPWTLVTWGLVALTLAAGIAAWWVGIVSRNYDYDEVQRAHSVWLASQGLRPYSEFFEVHPPYFVLLAPIVRTWTDPCDLLRALRLFSLAGNLAFLGALVALGWRCAETRSHWAWLGVACVGFHPRVLDYLVEFRIDGWGYALVAWSLFGCLGRLDKPTYLTIFGVLSGTATLLFCPKVALLPPLIVLCEVLRSRPGLHRGVRRAAAYVIGLAIAGVLFVLFLLASGIPLDGTYLLLFRYHTLSNAHSAYHHGLMRQIATAPFLLVPILLGLVAWVVDTRRRCSLGDAYLPAVGVWLLIQALLVSYPYKQYYAPWFLFGSAFAIVLGNRLETLWRPLGGVAAVAACLGTLLACVGIAQLWMRYNPGRAECAAIRVMNILAGIRDSVVAPPPHHPILRLDAFFLWFNTSDPQGYDSERILAELGPYRREVSPEAYRAALASSPPAFVVLRAGPVHAAYPAGQRRALEDLLTRHAYHFVQFHSLLVALRPDRYAQLQHHGLFEDAPDTDHLKVRPSGAWPRDGP
jgi:hypothetical protein